MRKAVFIDRDGTLIKDVPYNSSPALITLEYYAGEMLYELKQRGYLLIVISNQSGIAKGFFNEEDVNKMQEEIRRILLKYNVQMDGFYYCPHLPQGSVKEYAVECDCRKPKPGLLFKAANDFKIDLKKSWMIGDILHDVEAGNLAGCKTILLDNGNETEWLLKQERVPEYWAKNLYEATEIISSYELEQV